MNIIAQNISLKMKAAGLTIMALEAKAGLNPHAVRNIVTGKSKNPSAVNLQAIADALNSNIKDLLEIPKGLQQDEFCLRLSIETLLQKTHTTSSLMEECVRVVDELFQKNKKPITTTQYLTCVREAYLHSLEKSPSTVNKAFAKWFISLTCNCGSDFFYKPQRSKETPGRSRRFELLTF